jgi:hypothetical protein
MSFIAGPPRRQAGAGLAAARCPFQQDQAIAAEEHVGLVQEHGGRAEAAAPDQLVSVGAQPVLAVLRVDPGEEGGGVEAGGSGDLADHAIVVDIAEITPIGLEHPGRIGRDQARIERDEGAPHQADHRHRVAGRAARAQARGAEIARQVLAVLVRIVFLRRDWIGAILGDAGVDGVEHATDQHRLPDQLGAYFGAKAFDAKESAPRIRA